MILTQKISLTSVTYGQESNEIHKPLNGLELFTLGDSIVKFNGVLSCAELSFNLLTVGDSIEKIKSLMKTEAKKRDVINLEGKINCTAFRFLPAEKDSLELGPVKFKDVFLMIDKRKKITEVSVMKGYLKTDSAYSKKSAEQDYQALKAFLTSFLQINGEVSQPKQEESKYYSKDEMIWVKGDVKYVLTKTNSRNKKINLTHQVYFSFCEL